MKKTSQPKVRPSPCPGGCNHSDAEHRAFDLGLSHGEQGRQLKRAYRDPGLFEAYESGRSTGLLNRKEAQ